MSTTEAKKKTTKDPAQEEVERAVEEQREEMEVIVPNRDNRDQTIGLRENAVTFTQRPLSYFGKMEWYSLLGQALDAMLSEDSGISITQMLGSVNVRGGGLSMSDFRDADQFIKAITRLMVYAPDFLEDSYCIWLGVPRGDRGWTKELMRQPEEAGGLSDDDGLMILQTFIDQNIDAIESFFVERVPKIFRRIQAVSKRMNGDSPDTGSDS
jgi:hypothetical protein